MEMAVQVVAIDPSAAFRKALRMRLPPTAVDHFHVISMANQSVTETLQNLCMPFKGRNGRTVDNAWAHRMVLLRRRHPHGEGSPPALRRVRRLRSRQCGKSMNNGGACCAPARWRTPRRRGRSRGTGQGRRLTGDEQALPCRLPMVERGRGAHHYWRHHLHERS
ncbi:transposase [Arthrobacter gyeryongensis]|uniref:transposase n=1 Tax=Arthrobacter gyeryongensis TaxID=1650592 RepID=UPI003CD08A47